MLARIVLAVAPVLALVMLAVNIEGVNASLIGIHVCLAENIVDFLIDYGGQVPHTGRFADTNNIGVPVAKLIG